MDRYAPTPWSMLIHSGLCSEGAGGVGGGEERVRSTGKERGGAKEKVKGAGKDKGEEKRRGWRRREMGRGDGSDKERR